MSKSSKIVECAVLVRTSLICCRSKWSKFLDQDKIPHFIWANCSFSAFLSFWFYFWKLYYEIIYVAFIRHLKKKNSVLFFLSLESATFLLLLLLLSKLLIFKLKLKFKLSSVIRIHIITLRINFHVNLHIFSVQFKSTINITRVRVVLKRKHSFIRLVIFAVYFRYRWLSVLSWVVQQR